MASRTANAGSPRGETKTEVTIDLPKPAHVSLVEPHRPADLSRGVPILAARFHNGVHFVQELLPASELAREIHVTTRATPPPGTQMVLEISWPELPCRVQLRVWVRRRTPEGMLVCRLFPDQAGSLQFLVNAVRETPRPVRLRKHRRYCVRVPIQWRPFGSVVMRGGVAENLSAGGILFSTITDAIDIDASVVVRLRSRTAGLDLVLTGVVRHVTSRSNGRVAIGMMFVYRNGSEQLNLRRLVRGFAAAGVVIVDPAISESEDLHDESGSGSRGGWASPTVPPRRGVQPPGSRDRSLGRRR